MYAKIFCKIMVKILVPLHSCSLKKAAVGWVSQLVKSAKAEFKMPERGMGCCCITLNLGL